MLDFSLKLTNIQIGTIFVSQDILNYSKEIQQILESRKHHSLLKINFWNAIKLFILGIYMCGPSRSQSVHHPQVSYPMFVRSPHPGQFTSGFQGFLENSSLVSQKSIVQDS